MRVLVTSTPRSTPPPEGISMLIGATIEWYQRHKSKFDIFGSFMGGGGFAALNVDSEQELNQIMAEMPFTPFSDTLVRPYVAGDAGLRQVQEIFQAMMPS